MSRLHNLRWCVTLLPAGLFAASATSPLLAQPAFTGSITFLMHNKAGHNETMMQTVKGNHLRIDMADAGTNARKAGGTMIFDGVAKTVTILMDERKMYMVISTDNVKRAGEEMAAAQSTKPSPRGAKSPAAKAEAASVKVTNTGRTERVAGISCEVWHVSGIHNGKPADSDVCVAKGVGFAPMQMAAGGMMGNAPTVPDMGRFGDILKDNRGVLKVTTFDQGKPFVELEATKVDRTSPSDAQFAPPPGYTRFTMPSIPNMPGLPKRPPPA